MTDRTRHVLIVEDDDAVRRLVSRLLTKHCPVRGVSSVEGAFDLLHTHDDWCGFVLDIVLADHNEGGFDVAATAMSLYPGVPAAIITGSIMKDTVNRAASIGATILAKPFREHEFLPFIHRLTSHEREIRAPFTDRLAAISRAWHFTPREHEVLRWFTAGGTREDFLVHARIAETTLKSHVKHMLEKSGVATLSELVSSALRLSMDPSTRLPDVSPSAGPSRRTRPPAIPSAVWVPGKRPKS